MENMVVDGKIILKLILNKQGVVMWTRFASLRAGTIGGCL
jgi:hypothetical protein